MAPLLVLLLVLVSAVVAQDGIDWKAVGAAYTKAMVAQAATCGATPEQLARWATCATIDKPGCSRDLQRFVTACITPQ